MEYLITPRDELISRISRFQKLLQENKLTGALISQDVDLFYFAGTIQASQLYIPTVGEPILMVYKDFDRALRESNLTQIVPLGGMHLLHETLSNFQYSFVGRIGLEMDVLPANNYLSYCESFPEVIFVDISNLIRTIRMIKSQFEISQFKLGCLVLNDTLQKVRDEIKPGMTELEVDAIIGYMIRMNGHQGLIRMRGYNQDMFYAHVICGRSGALPSYLSSPLGGGTGTTPAIAKGAGFNLITENTPIVIDLGVAINGYTTDVTRTFVIGRLSKELEQAYQFCREVKEFMENWIKPGRLCSDLFGDVMNLVRKAGYQDYFGGYGNNQVVFVGHGIGLEINEFPIITPGFQQEFQENMVFAFEPKLVFPDVGAVGLEDDYVVHKDGVERLSTYEDNILVI